MKNSKALFSYLVANIHLPEERSEIESLAYLMLEDLFGIDRLNVLAGTPVEWSVEKELLFHHSLERLNAGEPIQYISGMAFFCGRRFFVDRSVLIPRPETEELVWHIIDFVKQHNPEGRVLDIGTGSGCIPITLAAELPLAAVMATDISDKALAVARQNAIAHKVQVQLLLHDILNNGIPFKNLDAIVSNPPYITNSEMPMLQPNVIEHEPHLALFVPDEDPLVFYRAIADQAVEVLEKDGLLAFEVNQRFSNGVADVLKDRGFHHIEIVKDVFGNPRIVKGNQS